MKQLSGYWKENKKTLLSWTGALIGVLVFLFIYGVQVIVPTNVDWLLVGGDLSQHYIGWEFFRNSEWTFPLGVATNLAYPHGLAITFMDSIPFAAIPAKVFAGVLSQHFQYFGLWGLFCYAMTGAITALIVRKWTQDWRLLLPIVLFVGFSPIMLQRMFAHTALASHWIILWGIYALLNARQWSLRHTVGMWSAILVVSVMVHPYFLVMSGMMLLLSVVVRFKTLKHAAIEVAVPVVAGILATGLIGGLTFTSLSGMLFGQSGYDLAAPILSGGWSVFNILPQEIKMETFAYLGIGGMMAVIIATTLMVQQRQYIKKQLYKNKPKVLATMAILALWMLIALGPQIHVAGHTMLTYDILMFVEKIWGVFRVTARIAWPLWYLAVLGSFYVIVRFIRNDRLKLFVTVAVCAIQLIDIVGSHQFDMKVQRFTHVQNDRFVSTLNSPEWNGAISGKKHIVYLGDLYESKFVNVAQFAIENHLTLNTGYFARKPAKVIQQTIDDAKSALAKGDIDKETIYIYDQPFVVASDLRQSKIDGLYVTTK